MKIIYLDNSTTTRPSEKAISAMMPYFTDMWGTPSAPHQMGQSLCFSLKEAYRSLYKLLGASERDSIVFTSSGAEAVNNAFLSAYFDITLINGRNHFIIAKTEEASSLMSINRLEELGCVGTLLPVLPSGIITADMVADAITPRTAMISLSWANGLTGVIQPVKEIAALCKERGILFHVDATHVLGKLYFELKEYDIDLISFNGDHIHAPKGTGGLYIKSGVKCSSFIQGGLEQGGRRAGTYNIPGLVALGAAAQEADEARDFFCIEAGRLRDRFEAGILELIPNAMIFCRDEDRLPHCSAIGFPGVSNEALLYLINRKGICASIGGGAFQQIALILEALGVQNALANSAISFSLSRETTEQEIDAAIQIISTSFQTLTKISGYFTKGSDYGN